MLHIYIGVLIWLGDMFPVTLPPSSPFSEFNVLDLLFMDFCYIGVMLLLISKKSSGQST